MIVYVDDLGMGDVGYLGSEIQTPHIDALAHSGLILDRFYACAACTPSRAQLLTGKYAARVGLDRLVHYKSEHGLAAGVPTLASLLGQSGYRTYMVGKWHLGHRSAQYHPMRHGFDHFYGHLSGWVDYHTHRRNGELDWYRDEQLLSEEGYNTALLSAEAVRIVEASRDEEDPFFLYLAYSAPHFPVHVAPGKSLSGIGSVTRQSYRSMVEALDDGIGELTRALQQTGLAEETLLFFASDNGGIEAKGGDNAALRGAKFSVYEGGLHVPAVLNWPGRFEAGRSAQLITNLDILPTLCAAAGIAASELPLDLDGANLLTPLLEQRVVAHADVFFTIFHHKLQKSALLRGTTKVIHYEAHDGSESSEFYALASDPAETRDLSSVRVQQSAEWLAALQHLRDLTLEPASPESSTLPQN